MSNGSKHTSFEKSAGVGIGRLISKALETGIEAATQTIEGAAKRDIESARHELAHAPEGILKSWAIGLIERATSLLDGANRHAERPIEPPFVAEFLVGLCVKKRYRKALRDDLDEVFQRDLSNGMTVGRARLRYWAAALNSIAPQLWSAAKRVGFLGILADYARRLLP
jgi:hypothetical protein